MIFIPLVGLAIKLRERVSDRLWKTYIFFFIWVLLSVGVHLQIIALDATVYEPWFYTAVAGVLGIIGVLIVAYQSRIKPYWFMSIIVIILILFGLRTAVRANDWRSNYILALSDISASKEHYNAYNDLALYEINQRNDLKKAKELLVRSTNIYPVNTNLSNLGYVQMRLGDYPGAYDSIIQAIEHNPTSFAYRNLSVLTLVYGDRSKSRNVLLNSLQKFPNDPFLWTSLALHAQQSGENDLAKQALQKVRANGGLVQTDIYNGIMRNQHFKTTYAGLEISI